MFAEQPQGSVLITAGFGLPCSSAFLQDLVHLLRRFRLSFDADDVKLSLRNIDLDQVTFRYQWPITGPVEAPEKRPSVINAIERPSSLSELMASLV